MSRRDHERQTTFQFVFKARKPKRGWHLVCLKRRKIYGQVGTVRPDRTFKYIGPYGVIVDSRKSGRTWETIQYDRSGEFRFLEEVPRDFS